MFNTFESGNHLDALDFITDVDSCNIVCNILIAWLGYAAISRNIDMCRAVMASVRLLFVVQNNLLVK